MPPSISIDEGLLKLRKPCIEKCWRIWEKSSFNIHRGVIEWADTPCAPVDDIAKRIRAGVNSEFKPGWLRGFAFGTILHLNSAPTDFCEICQHIDRRNKAAGVWQWAVVVFDQDRVALGIHTWMHGFLRPVYESVLNQLASQGYQCHSVDAEIDPLIDTLRKIGKVCHAIEGIGGVIR